MTALRAGVLRYVTEDGTIVESDARTPAPDESAGPVDVVDGAIASASVPMLFPPHAMADDDYVDGGVIEIIPVRAAVELGATRIIAVVAVPLVLPRDERDYADAPAGYIGLRAMAMIGIADRQLANLRTPLPSGTTLTTVDPVVDVVGLFEVQPGLLRINKDYGWLRAADVMAEGCPGPAGRRGRRDARVDRGALRSLASRGAAVGRHQGPDRRRRARSRSCVSRRSAFGSSSSSASSLASRYPTGARRGGASTRSTGPSVPLVAGDAVSASGDSSFTDH